MLLTMAELEAIRSGRISLVFRRWRRPTVRTGGTLKTAVGVLAIDRVARVPRSQITERGAADAGVGSLADLLARLDSRDGDIYRIDVRFAGADPRIALRDNDRLGRSDVDGVRARLARLDSASRRGPWTLTTLRAIDRHPRVAAARLAGALGFDTAWLKQNVRKLKDLGLTISHEAGYELSPRGRAILDRLQQRA